MRVFFSPPDPKEKAKAAVLKGRAALLTEEQKTVRRIARRYRAAEAEVRKRVTQVFRRAEADRRAGRAVSHSALFEDFRYRSILEQIGVELSGLAGETAADIEKGKREAGREGVKAQNAAMTARLGFRFDRLPVEALDYLAGRLADGTPLSEVMRRKAGALSQELSDGLFAALAAGDNPRKAARDIARLVGIDAKDTITLARNEMVGAHRAASQENHRRNARLLRGWVWLSARDKRTCPSCLAMDGTEHPLSEELESHVGCRCTSLPILKDDPKDAPYGTGEDWFLAQSPETQAGILSGTAGKRGIAYRLFAAGKVGLKDFTMRTNHPQWGPGRQVKPIKRMVADGTIGPLDILEVRSGSGST